MDGVTFVKLYIQSGAPFDSAHTVFPDMPSANPSVYVCVAYNDNVVLKSSKRKASRLDWSDEPLGDRKAAFACYDPGAVVVINVYAARWLRKDIHLASAVVAVADLIPDTEIEIPVECLLVPGGAHGPSAAATAPTGGELTVLVFRVAPQAAAMVPMDADEMDALSAADLLGAQVESLDSARAAARVRIETLQAASALQFQGKAKDLPPPIAHRLDEVFATLASGSKTFCRADAAAYVAAAAAVSPVYAGLDPPTTAKAIMAFFGVRSKSGSVSASVFKDTLARISYKASLAPEDIARGLARLAGYFPLPPQSGSISGSSSGSSNSSSSSSSGSGIRSESGDATACSDSNDSASSSSSSPSSPLSSSSSSSSSSSDSKCSRAPSPT